VRIIFGIGEVYNTTEIKINGKFDMFTNFQSLELKVPMFCFVTKCVSARRDRR
jgi:hypothetical protein